ncbi:MAG: hypothetical protein NDI61_02105 [Bdellovibrionaceae bacterium]|nr:hypothetical protein [Pseudobdellovibrionaceae bacterium]
MSQFAYVFAGRNGLDQVCVRSQVLRIPEVSQRVREAQALLDAQELPRMDLFTLLGSDDETFFRNLQLKSLAAAVVQVGLFDRLKKSPTRRLEILVGPANGDSALATVTGRQSFSDMVLHSAAVETLRAAVVAPERLSLVTPLTAAPLLAGVSLAEYEAIALNSETQAPETILTGQMDVMKLLKELVDMRGVRGFVNIGPNGLVSRERWDLEEIEVIDSIELDPMLNWFWSAVRSENQSIAN